MHTIRSATINVRDAKLQDAAAICEIANQTLVDPTISWRDTALTTDKVGGWFWPSMSQKHTILVAEHSGVVLGFLTLSEFKPEPGYALTKVLSAYVFRAAQGMGLGTAFLACAQTPRPGVQTLVASIDAANEASVHLHQRIGFKHTRHLPNVGFVE